MKKVYTFVVDGEPQCTFRRVDDHDSVEETFKFLLHGFQLDIHRCAFRLATIPERAVWSQGLVAQMARYDGREGYYPELLNVNLGPGGTFPMFSKRRSRTSKGVLK